MAHNTLVRKKHFREGRDDFLITIAKIVEGRPVNGVLLAPVRQELFFTTSRTRAYRVDDFDPGMDLQLDQLTKDRNRIRPLPESAFFKILKNKPTANKKTE